MGQPLSTTGLTGWERHRWGRLGACCVPASPHQRPARAFLPPRTPQAALHLLAPLPSSALPDWPRSAQIGVCSGR